LLSFVAPCRISADPPIHRLSGTIRHTNNKPISFVLQDFYAHVLIEQFYGDRTVERPLLPLEGVAEPAVLDRSQVFDQSQQAGAGRRHRTAQLLVVEAVDLPQHHVTVPIKADVRALLLPTGERHSLAHPRNLTAQPDIRLDMCASCSIGDRAGPYQGAAVRIDPIP